MAEKEALKKLEDQLNCPICLDTYTDPKQLNCNHVFCWQCLTRLVIRDQQGQLVLTCPNCRQVTPVPANGVAGLQAAFQINQLLEIVEEHKKAKDAERVESASTSPTPHANITVGCPQHGGKEVDLYCETCGETICWKCIMKDEKHHSHNYKELNEAFERYKEEIMSSLEPMEKQLVDIKRALTQLDTRCEEIANQQATMEANIHHTIGKLHQTLDVRKTDLIGQLHRLTQAKLKSFAAQRDQIETTQARLSSCLHFMRENLETGNQGEALMMKSTTVRQVKELTTTFQPDMLEPNTEADMIFSSLADITAVIQNYGRVHEQDSQDPSKCTASGKGVEGAEVWEKATALLQTLSFDNQLSKKSTLCVMACGLFGTGKSTLLNKLCGKEAFEIGYMFPTTDKVNTYTVEKENYKLTLCDTPGFGDESDNEDKYLEMIKRECADVDTLLYCIRVDGPRIKMKDDLATLQMLCSTLTKSIWNQCVIVLTFANALIEEVKESILEDENEAGLTRETHTIQEDICQEYKRRIQMWKERILDTFRKAGINPDNIPIVEAGHAKNPLLFPTDEKPWQTTLWESVRNVSHKDGKDVLQHFTPPEVANKQELTFWGKLRAKFLV